MDGATGGRDRLLEEGYTMKKLELVFTAALGLAVVGAFVAAPEAKAHGAACGSACVDADNDGSADDLAKCKEEIDQDPSDGICGCIRVPGHLPEEGQPIYDAGAPDHVNAASISGFANEGGPNGCIDVNGEAGIYSTDGNTDVDGCRQTAGQACFDNGCADIEIDSESCASGS